MDTTRQVNPESPQSHARFGMLLGMVALALGTVTIAGCAAEEKNPQTVTEFMRQPRVGEEFR